MKELHPADRVMLNIIDEIQPATSNELKDKFDEDTEYSISTAQTALSNLKDTEYVKRGKCIECPIMHVWETADPEDIAEVQ